MARLLANTQPRLTVPYVLLGSGVRLFGHQAGDRPHVLDVESAERGREPDGTPPNQEVGDTDVEAQATATYARLRLRFHISIPDLLIGSAGEGGRRLPSP